MQNGRIRPCLVDSWPRINADAFFSAGNNLTIPGKGEFGQ
jgi:hypothetical protein